MSPCLLVTLDLSTDTNRTNANERTRVRKPQGEAEELKPRFQNSRQGAQYLQTKMKEQQKKQQQQRKQQKNKKQEEKNNNNNNNKIKKRQRNIPVRHCLDSAIAFAGHNQTGPPSVWVRADTSCYFLDLEIRFLRHLPHSACCPKNWRWLPVPGLSTAQGPGPPLDVWCPKKARLRCRRPRIPPLAPLTPCCVEYSQLCRLNRPSRNHLRPYHRKPEERNQGLC